ncbi:MAG: glycosyltransferase family protein [Deltaproteobacteria bacterium]|nr:glycosyltransferase family protein [Deltaproteobacteria bacterium]
MRNILIIQARMGSERLPGKVLLPLGDAHVLDYVVARARAVRGVTEVVVATSTLAGDDPIVGFCAERDVPCFRGPERDVLSRFYHCAVAHRADRVIRVTADCPFVDHEQASEIVLAMDRAPVDIVKLRGEQPRGLWSEMLSFEALVRIHAAAKEPRHREHVTLLAYELGDQFSAAWIDVLSEMAHPELRITIDTPEDYALLQAVAAAFPSDRLVSSAAVVRFILDHPEVGALNAMIRQKPVV